MKTNLETKIKTLILSAIFISAIGVVGAEDFGVWNYPACGGGECNTPGLVNESVTSQGKEGDLYVVADEDIPSSSGEIYADRIGIWGDSFLFGSLDIGDGTEPSSLSVLGDVTLHDKRSANPLNAGVTYPADICVDSDGKTVICTGDTDTGFDPETFSMHDYTTIVETGLVEGNNVVATCPASHPNLIGGGGYCSSTGLGTSETVMKSIPYKNTGSPTYNAWMTDCENTNDTTTSYAICSI
ncbi:hypothetical protein KC842_01965 [Candidatus Nomurabacteria bacterium]|nr:hypothetical protein [Candidatus Nomurabacteria bacterium]USN94730.1 MAG: hypothetical protein H6791_03180 [Candidatus Nomurabacteria bacterium]